MHTNFNSIVYPGPRVNHRIPKLKLRWSCHVQMPITACVSLQSLYTSHILYYIFQPIYQLLFERIQKAIGKNQPLE